jgi:methyltransferase (TIGR00027 family)
MKAGRPSLTAVRVAMIRAGLERPELPTGDAAAERRLYESLGRKWLRHADRKAFERIQRRTAFFDRQVLAAIERGIRQVVIVAAGYDGRALRFASPGLTFFEVDHPSTQADKRKRLATIRASVEAIRFLPVDLTSDDLPGALRVAGHDAAQPSLFIIEGLITYLARSVVDKLLGDLRRAAGPGSRLAAAFPVVSDALPARERLGRRLRAGLLRVLGEPWVTRFDVEEVEPLLTAAGWRVSVDGGRRVWGQGHHGVLLAAEPA